MSKQRNIESDLSLIAACEWWGGYAEEADVRDVLKSAAARLKDLLVPKFEKAGPVLAAVADKVMDAIPGDDFCPNDFDGDRKKIYSALQELVRQGILRRTTYGRYARFDG